MKKIFYILASAIVALGAVACENEGLDNVNPENNVKGEGLTITAELTKVVWDNVTPSWEAGDSFEIEGFTFTTADGSAFTCTNKDVYNLVGQTKDITFGTWDSSKGVEGTVFTATGVMIQAEGTTAAFAPATALLQYTTTETVTFDGTALSASFEATGEGYIAVKAGEEVDFSYSVGGVTCKSLTKNFQAGKIYNLGTLDAPVILRPNSNWTQAEAWFVAYFCNGTSAAEAVKMTQSGDYYIAFVPEGDFKNVVFCRMNPAKTEHDWEDGSVWGQTQDMTINKGDICGIYNWNAGIYKSDYANNLYLVPDSNWLEASARFAVYTYGNAEDWDNMTALGKENLYYVAKSSFTKGNNMMIFCRMNPGNATNNWDSRWNQSGNLTIPTDDKNIYVVTTGSDWNNLTGSDWTEVMF